MTKYQVRFFDDEGLHIRQESISRGDDLVATSAMMDGADGHAMQLWDNGRKVHDLSKQSSKTIHSSRDTGVEGHPWDVTNDGEFAPFVALPHQHVSGHVYDETDSLDHWPEVYFIHDQDAAVVNVGCSLDGWSRLAKLRGRTGHTMTWLGCIYGEGGAATLSGVRDDFPQSRIGGDWFRASTQLLGRAEEARATYAREAFGNLNARVTKRMAAPPVLLSNLV